FRPGYHYVPIVFDQRLPAVPHIDTHYVSGYGRYSSGYARTETVVLPYEKFIARADGITTAVNGIGNDMTSLGHTAGYNLNNAERTISNAHWKVPLYAAAAVGASIGAVWLYKHNQQTSDEYETQMKAAADARAAGHAPTAATVPQVQVPQLPQLPQAAAPRFNFDDFQFGPTSTAPAQPVYPAVPEFPTIPHFSAAPETSAPVRSAGQYQLTDTEGTQQSHPGSASNLRF
ncbi:MAG: hypothetical protein H7123_09650, partial [Thermoleophilia bacterium]|nr:hypothetical protein [Thermoleophilia bacterium]